MSSMIKDKLPKPIELIEAIQKCYGHFAETGTKLERNTDEVTEVATEVVPNDIIYKFFDKYWTSTGQATKQ